jgi:hypothetical protein
MRKVRAAALYRPAGNCCNNSVALSTSIRVANTGCCSSSSRRKMRASVSTDFDWPKTTSENPQRRQRSRSSVTSPSSAVAGAVTFATNSACESRPLIRAAVSSSTSFRSIPPSYRASKGPATGTMPLRGDGNYRLVRLAMGELNRSSCRNTERHLYSSRSTGGRSLQ